MQWITVKSLPVPIFHGSPFKQISFQEMLKVDKI